ncbi:MAG: adenylate kinase [Candidatus Diapherotrites archaeon]|nr:adenylate kinase [Candidatus Diapherotrites archaeon]
MVNIVLFGPPGSGKGTIARKLWEKFGIKQVSTGDLLRREILEGTPLGKKVEPILASGKLVDNKIVARVLEKGIRGAKNGFVLDGFPRNGEQAGILEGILAKTGQKIDLVLELVVPDGKIIERLSSRRQCSKCGRVYGLHLPPKKEGVCDECGGKLFQRDDDKPYVIKKRLALYKEETLPLKTYFRKSTRVESIDGAPAIEEVFLAAEKKIASLGK